MKRKKSILFVSYYFDPVMLTATRNFYIAHVLALQGHDVHILGQVTDQAKKYLLPNQFVHSVSALDYRKILKWLGAKDGVTNQLIKKPLFVNWVHSFLLNYPWNKWLAEGGGLYLAKAIKMGDKLIKEHHIDIIYSSYRPISDHFIAENIKRRNPSINWVGDFRDVLWWKSTDKQYQKKWIRNMLGNMDMISAVTKGISDFWSKVSSHKVIPVYNGLPFFAKVKTVESTAKFEINYTGRIYTDFQKADALLAAIKELVAENTQIKNDLLIRYSGFQYLHWNRWIEAYGLNAYNHSSFQVNQTTALQYQSNASINILLTWCNDEIQGFIHGKFNEYVMARKPILCLVEGKMDMELKQMYDELGNSIILTNKSENIKEIKKFILDTYNAWQSNTEKLIREEIMDTYDWNRTAAPLLKFIESL